MKLGLIGLKGHQSTVIKGAEMLGDVELIGVSDDSEEELARFKRRTPLAKAAQAYPDWRQLLEHAPMDVCCVCDENGIRAEQLIELAKRNVHIVTEKPLATTLEDLERVRTALAASKSRLTMLLTMRHDSKYATMRKLVQSGIIGDVCLATAQKSYRLGNRPEWFTERARLGGTIPYIGIHAIDMMHWVTSLDYTHVAAFHGRIGKPQMKETENHASILLRFSNGASSTARLDYLRPQPAPSHGDDRLRIAGTEGVIELRYPDKEIRVITGEKKPYTAKPGDETNLFVEFVKAIRKETKLPIPADACFYATEVVLKARNAAEQKKMIDIEPRRK